jgi:hypothetical protein
MILAHDRKQHVCVRATGKINNRQTSQEQPGAARNSQERRKKMTSSCGSDEHV